MFADAAKAVSTGIVKEGNGWWHRPRNGGDFLYYYYSADGEVGAGSKLTFDTDAAKVVYEDLENASQVTKIIPKDIFGMEWSDWHTSVSSADTVLFWFGGSWNWADWAVNFVADRGGEDFLFENIGFGAIPAGLTGRAITLTHPLVYMISSQTDHPDLAIELIANTTVKELNTPYAVASGHLGILKSQATYTPYTSAKYLSLVQPMLEFTTFLPNSPWWSAWSEAYFLGIQATESGDLNASEAVDVVVDQLLNELGDNIEIQ